MPVSALDSPPTAAARPPDSAAPAPGRIRVLDGWRGVSILLVVAGHLEQFRYGHGSESDLGYRLAEAYSTSGVCLFFTISGFIIMSLAAKERRETEEFSAGAFYVRRFFRIVPPLFAYLAVVLLCGWAGLIVQTAVQTRHAAEFICNVTYVDCGWFGGHTWSLAYEEQFYVLFPLLLLLPTLRVTRGVMWVVCALLLLAPAFWHELRLGGSWLDALRAMYYASFICVGVLLALCQAVVERFCRGRHAYLSTCAALAVFVGATVVSALSHAPDAPWRLVQARQLLLPIIAPLSAAWLIGSSLYLSNGVTHALTARWLCFIGTVSYSLYLWQQLFAAQPSWYHRAGPLLFPPLMLACAVLSWLLIERPCVRIGKRYAGRFTPRARRPAQPRAAAQTA